LALHPSASLPLSSYPSSLPVCNQSSGIGRAAKIQFAFALLRLKNQGELFQVEGVKRMRAEGGRMTGLEGVERKSRKCSSFSVACCM